MEGGWMRSRRYIKRRLWILGAQASIFSMLAFCVLSSSQGLNFMNQPIPPYPTSPVLDGMILDWDTLDRRANGSDNWPITWAEDDDQYTSWGDGGGFGGSNQDGRVSLGVGRIEGSWDNYRSYNVWGGLNAENTATFEGKSYGILALMGRLYKWVSPGSDHHNYREARLAVSEDYGATWSTEDWSFTQDDRIVLPTFLQFGKGYTGARDSYVYVYAIRLQDARQLQVQKPGQIDLMRVPMGSIPDKAAYQFFSGWDGDGNPTWAGTLTDRQPVFENPHGVGWNLSVSYNTGLGRYLLATEHSRSFEGNLSLFDAEEPWGPWTTVGYYSNWEEAGRNFYWNFANKWASESGEEFTLVYSGIGESDAWHTVRGRFILKEPAEFSDLKTNTGHEVQLGKYRGIRTITSSKNIEMSGRYDPRIN
jgi:hypothetical protein